MGRNPIRLGRLFGARLLVEMPTYIGKTTALLHDPHWEGAKTIFLDDVFKGEMELDDLKTLKDGVFLNNRVLQAAATLLNTVSTFNYSNCCLFSPLCGRIMNPSPPCMISCIVILRTTPPGHLSWAL